MPIGLGEGYRAFGNFFEFGSKKKYEVNFQKSILDIL